MNDLVEAAIEIPMGTRNKYEMDPKTGKIHLSRVLYSTMSYPAEYGCIQGTLEKDGDPIDILVLTSEPTVPGCIVPAKIIGYLDTIDAGFQDTKLIAVNNVDPRYNYLNSLEEVPKHLLKEIEYFFKHYKDLQEIEVIVNQFHNKEEALARLYESKQRYQEKEII